MASRDFPPLAGTSLLIGTILLSFGNFLVVLDSTITNVSVPTISGDLGVSTTEGTWVITSYAVAEAITVPLTGWLAGRYGQVRLFVGAVLGFTLFSALCGLATNLETLVFFRVCQGLAGGPMIPMSSTLLLSIFPKKKSGAALAIWGMTTVVAPIAGPLLGGIICDNWHWSLIFFINVPFGLVVGGAAWAVMRKRETETVRQPIDGMGVVLLVVFVFSFQVMLDKGRELDWFSSSFITACGIVAALSLVLFVIWELTDKHPIVDLSVLQSRTWVVSTVTLALMFGLFIGNIVVTPLWLQQVMGYTPTWAGYATAPIGILAVVFSPIVGGLLGKVDPRAIVTFGMATLAVSFFMRAHLDTDAAFGDIALPLFVIGAGVPCCIIVLTALGVSDLPPDKVTAGSGLQNFLRVLSLAIGSSLSQTYLENATKSSRVELVNSMSPAAMSAFQDGSAADPAANTARMVFSRALDLQSSMLAINDFFALSTILILIFTAVIWFAKRPAGPLKGGAGH